MNRSSVHERVGPLPPSGRAEMSRSRGARGESTGHASEDVHAGEFVAVGLSAQFRKGFNRAAQVDRPAVPDVSSGAAACVKWLRTARVGHVLEFARATWAHL